MKLMHGDELRLRYLGEKGKPWNGVGHVIKIPDSILSFYCNFHICSLLASCYLLLIYNFSNIYWFVFVAESMHTVRLLSIKLLESKLCIFSLFTEYLFTV